MKLNKLPQHIGFILDGNGRWAMHLHKSRNYGHMKGVETLKEIVKLVKEMGIPYMTVYAFSVENMNRPKEEVDYLMELAKTEFSKIKERFEDTKNLDYNIKIIGEDECLSPEIIDIKNFINAKTNKEGAFTLFVAFNYSSKLEILKAAKSATDLKMLERNLYTYPAPPIDLIIRTSGEQRLSNFMLYQAAYAEIYFDRSYWPVYNKRHLYRALKWYSRRKRNFGKI